jgi:hypothetical protein
MIKILKRLKLDNLFNFNILKKDKPVINNITESKKAHCLICGKFTFFDSAEPLDNPCKRNSFYCRHCHSISRNRHIAKIILEKFPTKPKSRSLKDFSKKNEIKILNTCASGPIHEYLKDNKNYFVSEYFEDVKPGEYFNGIQCQNLEKTTFKNNMFDLIITEDIFEHISDPQKACIEIRRILKNGGYHISTISVFWNLSKSVKRAQTKEIGQIEYFLPPIYHGDPNRKDGILVFTDFGSDIVKEYLSFTGKTEVFWSNGNVEDQKKYAIYNNMVFISKKD